VHPRSLIEHISEDIVGVPVSICFECGDLSHQAMLQLVETDQRRECVLSAAITGKRTARDGWLSPFRLLSDAPDPRQRRVVPCPSGSFNRLQMATIRQ
jgi:hypothetical protein